MRAKVIVNPSSGRQIFQRNATRIIDKLRKEQILSHVSTVHTQAAGDAFNAAHDMSPGEFDFVMGVGGDGTVNEIVNGLVKGGSGTPLAILPAGTVNDFASSLCLPREVNSFCSMIRTFNTAPIDIGKIDGRYFLNVAAAGMLTDVAYKVPADTKTVLGRVAYFIEGAVNLPTQLYQNIPFHVRAEEADVDVLRDSLLFTVSNSPSVGGFRKAAPKAKVNDGLLDVLIVHKPTIGDLMPFLMQLMIGEHDKNPMVTYFQTSRLTIGAEIEDPIQMDLDGEKGGILPVTIECVSSAIRLIVPEKTKKNCLLP